MKRLAAIAFVLVCACPGDPMLDDTATIVGVVTSANGSPLEGTRITSMPVTETVLTDATGSYKLEMKVKRGQTYQLFAAREGYIDKTDTIFTMHGENRLDFSLVLVVICTNGDARCLNGNMIERCDPTGTLYTPTPCPQGQVCDDTAGMTSAVCAPQEKLTVMTVGSGGGVVVSSPIGLSCEPTCERNFPQGRMVTLTASPFQLSDFIGFSGDCTSTTTQCSVTMDSAKDVAARFDSSGYLLTLNRLGGRGRITSTPAGINCGAVCNAGFPMNTDITLTANPDPGSVFGGWGGACQSAGTNLTCMFTLNRSQTIDFRFMTPQFDLAVAKAGTGVGTVSSQPDGIDCGPDCAESYDVGEMVTLTAAPMTGSNFIGWTGDCTGTGDCVLMMDVDHAVTATFDGIAHNVAVTKMGTGTGVITSNPSGINCGATCNASFGEGQALDLVAMPTNGSLFSGWGGACATAMMMTTCSVIVDADLTASATFDPFYYGPFTADAPCQILIHFDAPTPLAQQCGGGSPATTAGTYTAIMSRTAPLVTAVQAGGTDEEGHVELAKLSPATGRATIEMTVRKAGAAFNTRTFGAIYSDEDALDLATHGVRMYVRDDGRLGVATRAASGTTSTLESAMNAIQDNTWYHVAATINSTTGMQLFVDGARVAMTGGPLGWTASASTAWAGAEREGGAGSIYRFNGTIDEIRVSDVLRY